MSLRAAYWAAALVTGLLLLCAGSTARAVECRNESYDSNSYSICDVDVETENLRLFLRDDDDKPIGHFSTLRKNLEQQGHVLSFATNAGMYHTDRSPVGLFIQEGAEEMHLVTNAGPGNFGLLPNGVFCINDNHAYVIETLSFEDREQTCRDATQSGPMLVIDGELHPRFLADSDSVYIRNGVGTSADGTRAVFVISRNAVTFHQFASLFRDHLKLPNALYFDGNISRLHAPQLERSDAGFMMGPIVGVVE